jgi:hypothetical protein
VDDMPSLGRADESLLDYALGKCAAASVILLVEAGADVRARDKWGWTLLGRASGCMQPTLASKMLKRGAARRERRGIGSITSDFLIGTIPILLWMVVEARRLGVRHTWFFVVTTFLVAFAFSCPLFLLVREVRLRRRRPSM